MRDDRDAEREHQDEIPGGLHRKTCSGPPGGCGAARGFGLNYCHVGWPAPELMTIHPATATTIRKARVLAKEAITRQASRVGALIGESIRAGNWLAESVQSH